MCPLSKTLVMYYLTILVLLPTLNNLTTYLTTNSYDCVFIFKHVRP